MFGFGKASPGNNAREVVDKVGRGDAVLVDVRETGEWAMGHAEGAIHVPLGLVRVKLDPSAPDLPKGVKGKPMYVYCASGGRSGQAAQVLKGMGYDVTNLGGIGAWQAAGGKVVR